MSRCKVGGMTSVLKLLVGGTRSWLKVAGLIGLCATGAAAVATEPAGTDRVKLDRTVVSGSQELPKVLYILPWESTETRPELVYGLKPDSGDYMKRVSPASHRRQLEQTGALRSETSRSVQ